MSSDPVTIETKRRRIVIRPSNSIDGLGILHQIMADKWDLLDDLMEGTDAMRDRGERWLPKHEKETPHGWRRRLDRSFLFAAFKETIKSLTGKPFSQPVVLKNGERLPARLVPIEEDPDRTGRNLADWLREVMRTAQVYGLTHCLVDYPRNPIVESEGRAPTLLEEDQLGLRARFIHVPPRSLIGWDTESNETTGEEILTRIRILDRRVEPLGAFGDQLVEYVTIWTRETVHRWKKGNDDKDFVPLTNEPVPHGLGEIPLVTYYTERDGFMTASPPLYDLADANLQHWQTASDFANIMHVMRFATLFAKGIPKEDWETITVGPYSLLKTEQKDAVVEWIEHKGAATGAGMADIEKLEERMERLGLNPAVRKTGVNTATGVVVNDARSGSQLQAWAESLERFAVACYEMAARWTGDVLPEEFAVEVFKDFEVVLRGDVDLRELREARKQREITRKTYLDEIQRRGLIAESVDVDEEVEALEEEAADTAAMFAAAAPDDADDDPDDQDDPPQGSVGFGRPAAAGAANGA